MKLRALCLTTSLLSLLGASAIANAATITGTIYANSTAYPNSFAPIGPAPASSGTATFTLNGPSNIFNLDSYGNLSNTGNQNLDYTMGSFLTSGGDTVSNYTSTGTGASQSDNLNDSIIVFSGTTYLTNGATYSLTHDDGIYLFLLGIVGTSTGSYNTLAIDNPAPTSAYTDSFVFGGPTGLYQFSLQYAQVNGSPAELSGNIGAISSAATPEPSSILMLGTGLLSAAGMVRRRVKA